MLHSETTRHALDLSLLTAKSFTLLPRISIVRQYKVATEQLVLVDDHTASKPSSTDQSNVWREERKVRTR